LGSDTGFELQRMPTFGAVGFDDHGEDTVAVADAIGVSEPRAQALAGKPWPSDTQGCFRDSPAGITPGEVLA
jgi:hypothetical protein